ncbi:cell cycle checkpoint protein RAD17 isoform X4 [Ornithorhynchus anatinus]|uniref:cell cycle checkpoint protein RAD17 isoform X4 n=1 Tax=Ornithorhynchus anatinus TaxID=9258 RepID=UPI0019D4382B|nr:cell cycle checkpoint protein RAD17 isoform X4 [Ornithorhynchus anatinus]
MPQGRRPLQADDLFFKAVQIIYCGWKLSRLIMSKISLRRKVVPTKVTDWVQPSFNDSAGNANISTLSATSLGVNGTQQRKKDLPSTLESSKYRFPARKRGKSSEQVCDQSNSNRSLSENETWVDKYRPETQSELAVHKKKIEEVETWLKAQILKGQPKQGGSILLLTGPPGCGKTATLQILTKDLGIQVQEWINPVFLDFRKDDFKDMFNPESSFQAFPTRSQMTVFQEFILRANKYNKLQMVGDSLDTDKKLILVERLKQRKRCISITVEAAASIELTDMPNQFYRDPSGLHEILRRFVQIGRCPLVFIISDSLSGDSSQKLLFPKEIQEELSVSNISFNPVAPTIMMKVLNRIATAEGSLKGGKVVPDKTSLELICKGCSGDIRSAINSLQFSSSKDYSVESNPWSRKKGLPSLKSDTASSRAKQRKKAEGSLENQEVQAIGGKDASLFLFRALGKILYCKREPLKEFKYPRLPSHLTEYERDPLVMQPESRAILREYSASVATRGVMHSNKARGFACCQGGASFRPLHKPQWFLINKKYRDNCRAAKSLFSNFCLPPLCLQTLLLPYLALLTNPMRNQAQIAFIQDVGRLPLKRYFSRLKMEALTDKDQGITDPDSDDEANREGGQPTETFLHLDKCETEPRGSSPPSSQTTGNELPASQPQPATAQGIMKDEEIIIEDYDSD